MPHCPEVTQQPQIGSNDVSCICRTSWLPK